MIRATISSLLLASILNGPVTVGPSPVALSASCSESAPGHSSHVSVSTSFGGVFPTVGKYHGIGQRLDQRCARGG